MVTQCTPIIGEAVTKLARCVTSPALEIIGTENGAGVIKPERNLLGRDVITEVDGGEIIAHFA